MTILENWGGLWMAHSLFTLLLCLLTWGMQRLGVEQRWPYMVTWFAGVMIWELSQDDEHHSLLNALNDGLQEK